MTRLILFPVSAFLFCVAFSSPTAAENWTEFRGPTGQGHSSETGLPINWGPRTNVAWNVPIDGHGWSSPIYYNGRLFMTAAVPGPSGDQDDQSLRSLCLDAKTGKQIWDTEVFDRNIVSTKRLIHSKNGHASPTPVTDGKMVYVHFGTEGTAALTLDGEIVWKTQELRYKPRHGNGGSPALIGDLVVVTCDGQDVDYVAALDRNTGKLRWKTDRTVDLGLKFSFSTPLAIEVNGQKQIVCPGTGRVGAYDPKDGKEIWRVNYGDGYSVIPRPVHGHGLVYVCTGWSTPVLLAIRPTGRGDVTDTHVAWQTRRSVPNTPSVLLVGEELYMISDQGIATCMDAKSGRRHWQERLGGEYSASPIFADGLIYFQSENGDTTIVKAGTEFDEVGRNSLNNRTLASFAVADSAFFIRTDRALFRIQKR